MKKLCLLLLISTSLCAARKTKRKRTPSPTPSIQSEKSIEQEAPECPAILKVQSDSKRPRRQLASPATSDDDGDYAPGQQLPSPILSAMAQQMRAALTPSPAPSVVSIGSQDGPAPEAPTDRQALFAQIFERAMQKAQQDEEHAQSDAAQIIEQAADSLDQAKDLVESGQAAQALDIFDSAIEKYRDAYQKLVQVYLQKEDAEELDPSQRKDALLQLQDLIYGQTCAISAKLSAIKLLRESGAPIFDAPAAGGSYPPQPSLAPHAPSMGYGMPSFGGVPAVIIYNAPPMMPPFMPQYAPMPAPAPVAQKQEQPSEINQALSSAAAALITSFVEKKLQGDEEEEDDKK